MKNIFWFLCLLAMIFTSCSNENEIGSGTDTGSLKGQLTFTFPMSKVAGTYATVSPEGDEGVLNTGDMIIYMVDDATGKVDKVFPSGDIAVDATGTSPKATIIIPNDATGDKSFYFVANTATVSSSKLSGITASGSTLSDLLALTADDQTGHLSSSGGLLLTGSATVTSSAISGGGSTSVSMTRRVARFDVSNDSDSSLVSIKEILVSKAKLSGYIFEGNSPSISVGAATGSLPKIDFTSVSGANAGDCPSVFYLYPSDSVVIQLLAESYGVRQLYNVPLPTGGIQANKRYTIRTKDPENPVFEMVAVDWDNDQELDPVNQGMVSFSGISLTDDEGWASGSLTYDASAAGTTITMDVSTQSSKGVDVEVNSIAGTFADSVSVTTDTPILTYSASYKQQVTITVPQYTGKSAMETRIIIKDKANSLYREEVTVISGGDYYPATHSGWAGSNIYWNGTTLTFDDTTDRSHEKYQGVYFQWGSLWGISPVDAWNTASTVIYPPDGGTSTPSAEGFAAWSTGSAVTMPFVGDKLLDPAADKNRRDWAYLYQITHGKSGIGDICKWLTKKAGGTIHGKKWRMPTSNEFEAQADYGAAVGTFTAAANGTANSSGTLAMVAGYRKGSNVTTDPFFPASGNRFNSAGALGNFGSNGYAWSASPFSTATSGYGLSFNSSTVSPEYNSNRSNGFPVRCVAE